MNARRTRTQMKEETHQAFLDAGTELLKRRAPVGDVGHQIRTQDVIREAGKSTGTFYAHFASHEDYVEALLEHGLSVDRFVREEGDTVAFIKQLAAVGTKLEDLVRGAATWSFQLLKNDPYLPLQLGLTARIKEDEPAQDRLKRMYDALSEQYVEIYEELFALYGRRMRDGYTVEQLAVLITALGEGLAVRHLVDPDSVPPFENGTELIGDATLSLVLSMTEPTESTPHN